MRGKSLASIPDLAPTAYRPSGRFVILIPCLFDFPNCTGIQSMAMNNHRQSRLEPALAALQRAVTPEDFWQATHALMQAATTSCYVVLGLPSLGIMPFFLRTTMPTRDIGRFGQLAPLNTVVARRPGITIARMSDYYTPAPGDPFFEEFLKPDGWLYAAALLFWSGDGRFIGQLAALRSAAQRDFSDAELAELSLLHPQVNAAVNRLLSLEHTAATQVSLEHSLHALPLPIATVTWEMSISFANSAATEVVHHWRGGTTATRIPKTISSLPDDLAAVCLSLKESWNDAVRTHDFSRLTRSTTVPHPIAAGLQATIRLVESPAGRTLRPFFVIHFEQPRAPETEVTRALSQFALLSRAERAIAILAAEGHDNAAIARRLHRSHSTVRTHLRHIFQKLGITTRARLAPLLHGLRH
jgi:DNA-binding CsgD family transcriptional regulator